MASMRVPDKRPRRALAPTAYEGKPELSDASASMPSAMGVAAQNGRQMNATSTQKKQLKGIKCTANDCPANPGSKKEELPPPPELREAELYRLLRGSGDQTNEHVSFLILAALLFVVVLVVCYFSRRHRRRSDEQLYSQQLPEGHASTRNLRPGRTSPSGVEVVVTNPLAGDGEADGGSAAATEEAAALEQAAREHTAREAAAEAALGKPMRDMYSHQASALVAAADARSQAADAERERLDNKKKSRAHKVKKALGIGQAPQNVYGKKAGRKDSSQSARR